MGIPQEQASYRKVCWQGCILRGCSSPCWRTGNCGCQDSERYDKNSTIAQNCVEIERSRLWNSFFTLAWIRLWVDLSDLTAFSVLSLLLIIRCVDVCANYYNIARALVLPNILEATVIYISTVSTAAYFPSNSAERFQRFSIVFISQSPIKINLLELKMKM